MRSLSRPVASVAPGAEIVGGLITFTNLRVNCGHVANYNLLEIQLILSPVSKTVN